jgi:hypothetical protein
MLAYIYKIFALRMHTAGAAPGYFERGVVRIFEFLG